MSTATGIELGPGSCVLVGARPGADGADVSAVHLIEPAEWPAGSTALSDALRRVRQNKKLPRHARVVAWGLSGPSIPSDPVARAALQPLVDAGFRIDAVMTPAQALAAVAETRRKTGDGAVAWLSINTHGAAIAILYGGDVLFSRTIAWTYNWSASTPKQQLLQRYSLITHMAPELKRGIAAVKAEHGLTVDAVVTCGNLPDLRSLTMPLMEEMDLEIETLDSSDGLLPQGEAAQERFGEWAPAIRLACAAALAPLSTPSRRIPITIGAAILLGGFALAFYVARGRSIEPSVSGGASNPAALGARPAGQPVPAPVATSSTPARALPPPPALTSILMGGGRRLAVMNGAIVAAGDTVGPRTVARIDADAVILREPSGAEIRVPLRQPGRLR